jgi:hypothetical protein
MNVAYQVRRGKPFKKYCAFDFSLERQPITIIPVGATVEPEGNFFEISVTDDEFLVEVTGFDLHRDLIIDVEPEVDDAEAVQLLGAEEDQAAGGPAEVGPTAQ